MSALVAQQVVKVLLKEPWMAVPQSSKDGVGWLGMRAPRSDRGLYRSQLFGIIVANDSVNRVLELRVADFRNLNIPGMSMQFWMFDLAYDYVKTAQVFLPTTRLPPEVVITMLNRGAQLGRAAKLKDAINIPSAPVLLV